MRVSDNATVLPESVQKQAGRPTLIQIYNNGYGIELCQVPDFPIATKSMEEH